MGTKTLGVHVVGGLRGTVEQSEMGLEKPQRGEMQQGLRAEKLQLSVLNEKPKNA